MNEEVRNSGGSGDDSGGGNSGNVPMVPSAGSPTEVGTLGGLLPSQPIHNFDGDKMSKWRLTALAMRSKAVEAKDFPPEGVEVKYVFQQRIEQTDERDGEVNEYIRTVLITSDLKCYAFGSVGIAQDASLLLHTFGPGPFQPPVKVCLQVLETAKKRKLFTLVPA